MARASTPVIGREEDGYVAWCPALDIASQGDTVKDAKANLAETLALFFQCAPEEEIARRMKEDVIVTQIEVVVG
ncbi:MAG: type II toxin-antitoxin system HicB family antitoxin [Alphaproteobacteria bacterium]|jgi:predicted RNase H-like HicB family nuclease|nr:type II toxin-antitoxin system HicB family antitoxin [Alphaproteobacteria bacterium]